MGQARLVAMTMDPLVPFPDRMAAARHLDAPSRAKVESELLADLPEIWSRESRERFALLGVVGSEKAIDVLQTFSTSGDYPRNGRFRKTIEQTVSSIQARLGTKPEMSARDS